MFDLASSLRVLLSAVTLVLCTAAQPALAARDESSSDRVLSNQNWALGIAKIAQQMPYVGVKDRQLLAPLILLKSRWIDLDGTGLSLKLPLEGSVLFAIRGSVSPLEGYKSADSAALHGMAERGNPMLMGPSASWGTRPILLSITLAHDVSGHSHGNQARVQVSHTFVSGRWNWTPRIAEIWLDERYADYFYGVQEKEATNNRTVYHPGRANSHESGINLMHIIDDHHTLFIDVSHTKLGAEIRNSPIVDDKANLMVVVAGYVYRF